MNMPVDAFLTALYTKVDDWYQTEGQALLAGKVGAKPLFSDSEVITLALAQHWCGFQKEREWLRFIAHNYRALFPHLLSQSEFNRRARNLCWLINALRRWVVEQLDAYAAEYRLIDSTPIQVRHYGLSTAVTVSSNSVTGPGQGGNNGFVANASIDVLSYGSLATTSTQPT